MPLEDLGPTIGQNPVNQEVRTGIEVSAEFELKPGLNCIEVPDLSGPEFSTDPFDWPTRKERVPRSKEQVLEGMVQFLKKIEQQGGRLIQILELPYTANLDEAQYLDEIQSGVIRVAVVDKD